MDYYRPDCFRSATLMLASLTFVSWISPAIGGTSCGDVRRTFVMQRIGSASMVPFKPVDGSNLRICPNDGLLCCTRAMERKYLKSSQRNLLQAITTKMENLKSVFSSYLEQTQEDITYAIAKNRNDTLVVLSRAFPRELTRNTPKIVADSFFNGLRLARDQPDREAIEAELRGAIDRLLQSLVILKLQQGQARRFSSKVNRCLSKSYLKINPLGNLRDQMSTLLFTAFNQTLSFTQAVESGFEALKLAEKSVDSRQCRESVMKMQYCSHCHALTLIKPCPGLCKNVFRGCLVGMFELDLYWKHFVAALTATATDITANDQDIQSTMEQLTKTLSEVATNKTELSELKQMREECFTKAGGRRSKRYSEDDPRIGQRSSKSKKRRRRRRRGRLQQKQNALDPDDGRPPNFWDMVRPPYEVLKDRSHEFKSPEPQLGSRSSRNNEIQIDDVSVFSRMPQLRMGDKMLKFVVQLNFSVTFFLNLPDEICDSSKNGAFQVSEHGSCWDGKNIASRYNEHVAGMGLEAQQSNPEMEVKGVGTNIQQAAEKFRVTAKILLLPNGYDSIPKGLRKLPYFVGKNKQEFNVRSSVPTPCGDDEDDCAGASSGQGSGEVPDHGLNDKAKSDGNKGRRNRDEMQPSGKSSAVPSTVEELPASSSTSSEPSETSSSLPLTAEGTSAPKQGDNARLEESANGGDHNAAGIAFERNVWLRTLLFILALRAVALGPF